MGNPEHYRLTTISCFVGIFAQAVIINLAALLFMPLMRLHGLTYVQLGTLVAVNFSVQVGSDLVFSGLIDRIGFRRLVLPACLVGSLGLFLFALAPVLLPGRVFAGLLAATAVYSAAGGLLEVLLSPIVNAIPNEEKGAAMSLLHSFYAWGQMATIILTTLFLFLVGERHWQWMVGFWALLPLANFLLFLKAPFPPSVPEEHRLNMGDLILKPFCLLAFAAIFFGASAEVLMNQWTSAFMERALLLPKLTGDLFGMCGFALMLGLGRAWHGKYGARFDISKALVAMSALAVLCYLVVALAPGSWPGLLACMVCGFATSLLWPGTLIVASERYPLAGAWMFALLAAAGDVGAGLGPWFTGWVVDHAIDTAAALRLEQWLGIGGEQAALRLGILAGTIAPLLALLCHWGMKRMRENHRQTARAELPIGIP